MSIKDINSLSKDELVKQYLVMRSMLDDKSKKYSELQKKYEDLNVNYKDLSQKYEKEHEKYMQVVAAKYQTQKNNFVIDMPSLFDGTPY